VDGAHAQLHDPSVREVLVTDTVSLNDTEYPSVTVVSIAPLLAAEIQRLAARKPMGDLFQ
jgi:phosphoribosylpyrophosphate synthetase